MNGFRLHICPNNLFVKRQTNTAVFGGISMNLSAKNPLWTAPDPRPSRASDIYSLGLCFLFYLQKVLKVNLKFGQETKMSVLQRVERMKALTKENMVLSSLVQMLSQMVDHNPTSRPLLCDLSSFLLRTLEQMNAPKKVKTVLFTNDANK
jgi:serine/threonine protein kinase